MGASSRFATWIAVTAVGLLLSGFQGDPPSDQEEPSPAVCGVCLLWERYEGELRQCTVEAGALEHGVVYYISSSSLTVVESMQRFAYERRRMEEEPAAQIHARHRGMGAPEDLRLEVTTSARGFFALLTAADPAVIRFVREEASFAVRSHRPPRF